MPLDGRPPAVRAVGHSTHTHTHRHTHTQIQQETLCSRTRPELLIQIWQGRKCNNNEGMHTNFADARQTGMLLWHSTFVEPCCKDNARKEEARTWGRGQGGEAGEDQLRSFHGIPCLTDDTSHMSISFKVHVLSLDSKYKVHRLHWKTQHSYIPGEMCRLPGCLCRC